jgi:hypothetical protein
MQKKKRKPTRATKLAPNFKMSKAIMNLAKPLQKKHDNEAQMRNIIHMVTVAWNLSVVSDEDQKELRCRIDKHLPSKMGGEDIGWLKESLDWLIERKRQLYPHVNRFIQDHTVSIVGGKVMLVVGSVPIEKKKTESV